MGGWFQEILVMLMPSVAAQEGAGYYTQLRYSGYPVILIPLPHRNSFQEPGPGYGFIWNKAKYDERRGRSGDQLDAASARMLFLEPSSHCAHPCSQFSRDLRIRAAGGAESARLLDSISILIDPTSGAAEASVGPLARTRVARNFERRAALRALLKRFQHIHCRGKLQPYRAQQIQRRKTNSQAWMVASEA